MFEQKEAYHYMANYLPGLEGARINIVEGMQYIKTYHPARNGPATMSEQVTQAFMQEAVESQKNADFDDFFKQKVNLSSDRIGLVLGEITQRDNLKYDNLKRLYDDLLKVDNWRLERPYPFNYAKDKTWTDLNKMELQLRDQIRRELKDSVKDTSFPQKDLRESLLEFKVQNQKSQMLEGGLEMELDSSHQEQKGDSYQPQTMY
ncbi:hypothetical protein ACFL0O_05365 [Thermodesulfobacteriota bacterium]